MRMLAGLLMLVMVTAAAAPAYAGTPVAQTDPWTQWQQWLAQVTQRLTQLQSLSGNVLDQILALLRPWLQQSGALAFLQQLQAVLQALGQFGGPFAYAFNNMLADLQRLMSCVGGGSCSATTVGTPPWFAANNPATQQTVTRISESGTARTSATQRSTDAATSSAGVANNLATSTDISDTARSTYGIADELAQSGTHVSSTRAGVQVLIAGQAAALRAQADAMQAIGHRVTALSQQQAASSQQADALADVAAQIAANQEAQAQKDEEDKQALLDATRAGALATVDSMMKMLLVTGIIEQAPSSSPNDLFRFNWR